MARGAGVSSLKYISSFQPHRATAFQAFVESFLWDSNHCQHRNAPIFIANSFGRFDTGQMEHAGHSQDSVTVHAHVWNASSVQVAPSYLSHGEFSSVLLCHVLAMVLAWLIVLPLGVMLNLARSRHVLAANLSFVSLNAVGILFGAIYNGATPDLYEHNAHHTMGWAVTWILVGQSALGVINAYGSKSKTSSLRKAYHRIPDPPQTESYRYSHDSGQGTEPSTPQRMTPPDGSFNLDAEMARQHYRMDAETRDSEKCGPGPTLADRVLTKQVNHWTSPRLRWWTCLMYDVIDRFILLLGFALFLSGLVVYGGLFRGGAVFSGMAHFVKGGIFFWVGLVALARCMGSFADLGWAWNRRPSSHATTQGRTGRGFSMEFVESFLIFFYGATNVFLEHLGSPDGMWSAGDLEHVSISVMFFGGGLCGMLLESAKIQSLLNGALESPDLDGSGLPSEPQDPPSTYGFSFNPLPAIIILLLGIMMSSHHQSSMVATMMHAQWGSLFVAGALARGVTYVITYLSPPTSVLPSRPPSEIVVAFCLMSGGLIFMSSNSDMVLRMEMYDLNAMFSFSITIALTTLLMAWVIVVLAFKGWAVRREQRRRAADGFWT